MQLGFEEGSRLSQNTSAGNKTKQKVIILLRLK